MKYLLLAASATLLSTQAFGQTIEYSARGTANISAFRGQNSVSNSIVNYNRAATATSSTINPFGDNTGFGFGGSLRAQRVAKIGLLTAFDLGYDWLHARTDITRVNYNSADPVASPSVSVVTSNTAHLYTQTINAFAGIGWRLGEKKLKLDALVGPELAYILTSREQASGSTAYGAWSTDIKRTTANNVDFRLRADLTAWVKKVGLVASYSYGFTNYMPGTTTVASPEVYANIVRLGLAYRLK